MNIMCRCVIEPVEISCLWNGRLVTEQEFRALMLCQRVGGLRYIRDQKMWAGTVSSTTVHNLLIRREMVAWSPDVVTLPRQPPLELVLIG